MKGDNLTFQYKSSEIKSAFSDGVNMQHQKRTQNCRLMKARKFY